jgi:hypothetical protein
MMRRATCLLPMLYLIGCSAEPAEQQAKPAVKEEAAIDTTEAVKAEKKSIEDAAEAATKLIEAEANAEIESLVPEDIPPESSTK